MPQRNLLRLKLAFRFEWRNQDGQKQPQQRDHCARLADSLFERLKVRFSVHTGISSAAANSLASRSTSTPLRPSTAASSQRTLGIAGGVLLLSMLRSGLTAIGLPPFMDWIVAGTVLLTVGILDGDELSRRIYAVRHLLQAARTNDAAVGLERPRPR